MVEETFGRLRQARDEAISVFALMVVKICDRFHVEELVKDPTSPSPFVSVSNETNVPRIHTHAWGPRLAGGRYGHYGRLTDQPSGF